MCETLWMVFDFQRRKSKRLRLEISDLIDCYSTARSTSPLHWPEASPSAPGQILRESYLNRTRLLHARAHAELDRVVQFLNESSPTRYY